MSPTSPIQELQPGDRLEEAVYLLEQKQVRQTKSGSPYLDARLRDASGSIQARFWNLPPDLAGRLEEGGGVQVSGEVVSFQGRAQIKIATIQPQTIDPRAFLPTATLTAAAARAQLQAYIGSITDPWLRRLLEQVFEPAFLSRFLEAPAAKEYHHACIGGLAEHTLAVAGLAELIAPRYPDLDRDLLLAGALLHDVGKVDAYRWSTALGYSDPGEFLGHIHLGARRVDQAMAALPGFPEERGHLILHAVLAHHGQEEKGSPVRPKTLEALALHLLDTLDAHLRGFRDHLDRQSDPSAAWTDRSPMFGTRLHRGTGPTAAESDVPF